MKSSSDQRKTPPAHATVIPSKRSISGSLFSGLNVLIIDDDPFYRTLLSRTVLHIISNPQLLVVESFEDAKKAFNQSPRPFDLIIADLNLRVASTGIDLWRLSQTHSGNSAFLLISGATLNEFMELIGQDVEDMPSYLPKPFRLDHVRNLLEWLLASRVKAAG